MCDVPVVDEGGSGAMSKSAKVYCEFEPGKFNEDEFGPGPEPRQHLGPKDHPFPEHHWTNGIGEGPGANGLGVPAFDGQGPVGFPRRGPVGFPRNES